MTNGHKIESVVKSPKLSLVSSRSLPSNWCDGFKPSNWRLWKLEAWCLHDVNSGEWRGVMNYESIRNEAGWRLRCDWLCLRMRQKRSVLRAVARTIEYTIVAGMIVWSLSSTQTQTVINLSICVLCAVCCVLLCVLCLNFYLNIWILAVKIADVLDRGFVRCKIRENRK